MALTSQSRAVNIQDMLDNGPFGRVQFQAIFFCALVALLDGFDTQMMGVIAPSISHALGIELSKFGPVFSAALFGYMVGSIAIGPFADRFGRKWCMIASVLVFGGFTTITAHAQSYEQLIALRFLTGLGLGGASPCFVALTTEYAPAKYRAFLVTLLWASFPFGGMLGGFASSFLIPNYGWQSVFHVGGLLPILLIVLLVPLLPESLRFLAAKKGTCPETTKVLAKLEPALRDAPYHLVNTEQVERTASIKQLFAGKMASRTLLLWGAFFCTFCVLIAVGSWAPALLRDLGMPLTKAATVLAVYNIGGVVGTVLLGRLIDSYGAAKVLVTAFVLGALSLAPLGYATESFAAVLGIIGAAGFFIAGAGAGLVAMAAQLYPVSARTTGIGTALGIGRLGSVAGPLVGGIFLQRGWPMSELFLALCVPTFLAAVFIFWLSIVNRHDIEKVRAANAAA